MTRNNAYVILLYSLRLEYNPRSGDSDLKNIEKFDEFITEAGEAHQVIFCHLCFILKWWI